MKTIALLPLCALALAACDPYYAAGDPQPYPGSPQGYPEPGYPPYPDTPGYPAPGFPAPGYPETGYPPYPAPGYPSPGYPAPGYPSPGYPAPPPGPVYPGPGGLNQGSAPYRAIGTEPFWDLEIGRDMVFTDRGTSVSVSQPTPVPIQGVAGPVYRTPRIEVNITHRPCSDGMSDRSYPDSVQVYVDGRMYGGCGAPVSFFTGVDETGQPRPPVPPAGAPVADLGSSNWRVVAINGTRTPASNFYLNFMPDGRIGAKFGCNSLGAGYTQSGNLLSVGAIAATRMACPDMSFENQGSQILGRPVTVSGFGDRLTLSNARGSIELVRAR